jgi:hypothetical protein
MVIQLSPPDPYPIFENYNNPGERTKIHFYEIKTLCK